MKQMAADVKHKKTGTKYVIYDGEIHKKLFFPSSKPHPPPHAPPLIFMCVNYIFIKVFAYYSQPSPMLACFPSALQLSWTLDVGVKRYDGLASSLFQDFEEHTLILAIKIYENSGETMPRYCLNCVGISLKWN